jgi:pyroglutamyl-peptidase I
MAKSKKSRKHGSAETRNVLVTGFEPFGGEVINPSGEIARQLHGTVIGGHRVVGTLLPCVFGAALTELKKQISSTKPALIICVGQAGGRAEITPERVAINVDDARLPDNAGAAAGGSAGRARRAGGVLVDATDQGDRCGTLRRQGIPASGVADGGDLRVQSCFLRPDACAAPPEACARRFYPCAVTAGAGPEPA